MYDDSYELLSTADIVARTFKNYNLQYDPASFSLLKKNIIHLIQFYFVDYESLLINV